MTPRLVLVLSGLAFLAFGVAFLVWPVWMAGFVSLAPATPTAITEIRGMYGGLEIGIGVFLLGTAIKKTHVPVGLTGACLAFAGFAAGRLTGLVVDGYWQPTTWLLMALETAAAVLSVWALVGLRATRAATITEGPRGSDSGAPRAAAPDQPTPHP